MTTAEMILELRGLALLLSVPEARQFYKDVAFRLERLEKLKDHFLAAERAIRFDPGCKTEPSLRQSI